MSKSFFFKKNKREDGIAAGALESGLACHAKERE